MNSILQGRVTKRYSCDKAFTLERANFILRNQLEQMRFKLFILDEQKRQYEEYSSYLEETLSAYKAEEQIFEETSLNCTETEEQEKKNEKDDTVESALKEKNDAYWRCFWCLREHGEKGGYRQDYPTHLVKCHGKRLVKDSYQNEAIKCNECYGIKVVFQPCQDVSSKQKGPLCTACHSTLLYKNKNSLRKHVKNHQKWFSFICSCTDNFVLHV